ncbi:MAG TPA: hypothetical protein VFQ53_41610 [Kofleriaceae bacterium]|nr:hypothetical protein [Kofleriaceae bacterium]
MRWLLLLLVACGGARVAEPLANHAGATRHACTDELVATLTTKLAERWQVANLDLRCVAGRFGVLGFFLEARHGDRVRTGIVDASGAELVPFEDERPHDDATHINGYVAADLDGDGEDEIVESWRRDAYGAFGSDHWLAVRRVHDHAFTRIRGPHLGVSWPQLGACAATWELRQHAIVVVVQPLDGIPPTDCLPPGKHRFALRGRALEAAR